MSKRYVFDIDGTICSVTSGNYSDAKPIESRIIAINKLYDRGNEIVFFTARGMNRFDGNLNLVIKNFESITKSQLEEWNVKYHKLIMGKPSADVYVDDKGISDLMFFGQITSTRHQS
jgi:capsule biosynthesis phosphatase